MRKMFLAGAAALSIASAAHAADTNLPLTDPLVGHWCKVEDGVYKRGVWTCDSNLLVTQEDISGDRDHYCEFADVKRLPSKDGYTIKCSIGSEENSNSGKKVVELRIISGALHYREPDMGCSRVGENMSDGFLNLRAGPGTQYAVKARLVTGDILRVDEPATTNGWTRVSVPRFKANGKDFTGWVSGKHVVDSGLSCHTP